MKYIILITLSSSFLFFSGCKNKDFNKPIKEDVLEKTDKWYEIDSTRDLYQTFKFRANKLTKDRYSDRHFSEIIDSKSFDIHFTDGNKFNVTEDGVNYSCEVSSCEQDSYVFIGCKANEEGVKELLYCGWNSQDKADSNMQ